MFIIFCYPCQGFAEQTIAIALSLTRIISINSRSSLYRKTQ
ncbi:MAG: hypothetical protein SAL07_07030 [Oscillatoria sp. PMC 1051.18]|nr:hypothetical protein [Oscillatoria sp. PMC 1050.18]MEC5029650.1 hypothetical protein [Oscillatoria sp. PMC 1051.18]